MCLVEVMESYMMYQVDVIDMNVMDQVNVIDMNVMNQVEVIERLLLERDEIRQNQKDHSQRIWKLYWIYFLVSKKYLLTLSHLYVHLAVHRENNPFCQDPLFRALPAKAQKIPCNPLILSFCA